MRDSAPQEGSPPEDVAAPAAAPEAVTAPSAAPVALPAALPTAPVGKQRKQPAAAPLGKKRKESEPTDSQAKPSRSSSRVGLQGKPAAVQPFSSSQELCTEVHKVWVAGVGPPPSCNNKWDMPYADEGNESKTASWRERVVEKLTARAGFARKLAATPSDLVFGDALEELLTTAVQMKGKSLI